MKATDEFAHQELTQRVEDYRTAYQDRDLERMLAMFADDAVMFWSQGTFRGKAAIRTVLAQTCGNVPPRWSATPGWGCWRRAGRSCGSVRSR